MSEIRRTTVCRSIVSNGTLSTDIIAVTSTAQRRSHEQIELVEDFGNLYQHDPVSNQHSGHIPAFSDGFDPDSECTPEELVILSALRRFLRPQRAPSGLLERCLRSLDEVSADDLNEKTDRTNTEPMTTKASGDSRNDVGEEISIKDSEARHFSR
ncbi:MAG: hypothetical protein U0K19_02585 [Bifidobacteriaceae bacterium]|nr:hypothetical protein [Bifidobacteriaceae bacterium]